VPPEDLTPLEERIGRWLETQGYPLEMQVARACELQGARVVQSDYYPDLVFECKGSRDKPWVLFCTDQTRLSRVAQVAQRAGSRTARLLLRSIANDPEVQSLPIFSLPAQTGYSITQAFTSGHDVCYTAVSGAASAAAAEAERPDVHQVNESLFDFAEVVFPVVVTDAKLFQARLNQSLEIELDESHAGVLLWRNPMVGIPHTIVSILTLPGLPELVAQARESAERLFELLRGRLRESLRDVQITRAKERLRQPV
jgi:hypothetical protein